MSKFGTLQIILGPEEHIMFLYRGRYIFASKHRRGDVLFIICQEENCPAKGKLQNNPNTAAERYEIVSISEEHSHHPAVHM